MGHADPGAAPAPDFAAERASDDARYAAGWVLDGADNQGRPFAIVDKKAARIYVFEPSGRLVGASAVLLGLAPGDGSVADIAQPAPRQPAAGRAPTPAGRFESQPGHNDKGEEIVWVDYDAALAIHRLRPPRRGSGAMSAWRRRPEEHRISFGCIVVPIAFYEQVVMPTLGSRRGVVYVLPESSPVQAMFAALEMRPD